MIRSSENCVQQGAIHLKQHHLFMINATPHIHLAFPPCAPTSCGPRREGLLSDSMLTASPQLRLIRRERAAPPGVPGRPGDGVPRVRSEARTAGLWPRRPTSCRHSLKNSKPIPGSWSGLVPKHNIEKLIEKSLLYITHKMF